MATPNYGYEKRQRELAKKKKKEEKLRAKAAGRQQGDAHDTPDVAADDTSAASPGAPADGEGSD